MNNSHQSTIRLTTSLAAAAFLLSGLPQTVNAQAIDTLMSLRASDGPTRLSLFKDGGFFMNGNLDYGAGMSVPVEGSGTRLMWYPGKAAFRAGHIEGTQWDDANIGNASVAAGFNTRASGDYGTAFGYNSVAANTGSIAMGHYCIATGFASVALGYNAHTNTRQGSFVFADRSVPDDGDIMTDEAFRAGVNHSANWRVSGGFRIFTSSNLSTGFTFQSGSVTSNWGQNGAAISTSTGAMLTTSGIWQNASDSSRKHNIERISGEQVLARLRRLPITEWSYRNDGTVRHLGPMAQDFRAVFGLGSDEKSIGTVDADGVALAGVQALDARTTAQAADLKSLKAENETLRKRLEAVEARTGTTASADLSLTTTLLLVGAGIAGVLLSRRKEAKAVEEQA